MSKHYTEGDYQNALRSNHRPKLSFSQSYEMFLLDFYPYDKYEFKKLYGFDDEEDEEAEQDSDESTQDYRYDSSDGDDDWHQSEKPTFRRRQQGKKKPKDEQDQADRADFIVRAFGLVQIDGRYYSASLDLTHFQPFFYIKVPENWTQYQLDNLVTNMQAGAHFSFADHLVKWRLVKRKPFYFFTGQDQFQYAELTFSSLYAFRKYSWMLMKGIRGKIYQRLESNIEPMLRLIHIQNITPSGWIKIPAHQFQLPTLRTSDCQIHLKMNFSQVQALPMKISIPPLEVASFDIEADSSHGDFPVGRKDYQKLAQDFVTEFLKLPSHLRTESQLRNLIRCWLGLAFHNYYYNNNINQLQTEQSQLPLAESIASLVPYIHEYGQYYHRLQQQFTERFQLGVGAKTTDQSKPTDQDEERLQQEFRTLEQRLHHLLESYLPPLDLSYPHRTSHYGLLARQLLKEVHRALETNNRIYQQDPVGCIRFWLQLAFHPYYNNHNIHWIETKKNRKPQPSTLDNLVPQIYWILTECYQGLDYHQNSTGAASGKRPTKAKPPPLFKRAKPPSQGQRKMSSFFKVDKTESTVIPDETLITSKPDPFKDQEEELAVFYRGRLKKTKPEKPKRDFYVEWLRELFNQFLPSVQGDPIIQIGTTFKRYGEQELFLKHIIVLDTFEPFTSKELIQDENEGVNMTMKDALVEAKKLQLENPSRDLSTLNRQIQAARLARQQSRDQSVLRIESYGTEREVLLAWQRLIKQSDPDILTGYNIFGFDFKYLWERAEELDCVDQFRDLGRVHKYPHELKEQKLSSSGLGDNLLTYIPMTGRVIIDLFKIVQTGGYRLPIYKLDYVCSVFLSKKKNDLPPQQIFIMQKGSARDRSIIARYCLVDCILCNRLIDRLEIITNNIGMSQVCTVPLSYLFLRGQGIKILSLVSKICRQEGYLIKTKEHVDDPDKYEGAIVLAPKKGIYFEPCVVADFNSLYPSCMIAENLSHDSYVEIGGPYDNLPGCEYVDIQYDLYEERPIPGRKTTQKVKCGVKTCRYYQPPDGQKSLIPRILMQLLKARKDTRKEQKKYPKGSFSWNVKEGLQLAFKTTANSLYGQIGAKTSPVYLKDIAACTTSCGRTLIYDTKDFFETNYESSTAVYGDSVTGDTPILVQYPDGFVDYINIEDIGDNKWSTHHQTKEFCDVKDNLRVWSDNGFTEVNKVIRHKSQKNICQVLTHTGLIRVTEDHSLLDEKANKVRPSELKINDYLLHHDLPTSSITDIPEAYIMGLFYRDGLCGSYESKYIWTINNVDRNLLINVKNMCDKLFPTYKFKILETVESSHVYKLSLNGLKIKDFIYHWQDMFYDRYRSKKVPVCILNGSLETKKEFMKGYYDGDKDVNSYYQFDNKGMIGAAGLYYLNNCLGKKCGIDDQLDNVFRIAAKIQRNSPSTIKRIRNLGPTNEYVYDLETGNHHFSAGIGRIIAHNTDSIFMRFRTPKSQGRPLRGLDAVNKNIELCTEGSLAISRSLKKPHNLEFEKAIFPFMLLSKKRYHGHYYTDYGSSNYFAKSMGIVLKRRDNAEIVKTVFGGTLDVIMKDHDLQKAKKFCQQACRQVLQGNYPMDKFIITKTLRSYYKNPDQIAHNVLAQRIGERDPGNKPKSNDRLAYAYIQVPEPRKGEKILQGDRIETPEYIKEHNLPLDYKFYLTNQIMKPVSQIFELDDGARLSDLFTEALMEYDRQRAGISKISAWVAPDSKEYQKRVDAMLRDLLAEEDLDKDPDMKTVVEMYGQEG